MLRDVLIISLLVSWEGIVWVGYIAFVLGVGWLATRKRGGD